MALVLLYGTSHIFDTLGTLGILSLESFFSQTDEIPIEICKLHPLEVVKLSKCDFICTLTKNDL